ncbi:hypothetical protein [Cytobacillus praedii]|uniref:Uncharacterized protein n=1 Tax=Cytobacillus praedii TaxID=1742358 RepID=A0A4R1AX45_9BACI|nr:hypothetical protein [Cytobacillus praedii]TCJ05070.1 hypothetical protein E0Y62_07595 [Cytobacillus praedii]
MNEWLERANQMQKELNEFKSWLESVDWNTLPHGVKLMIVRGKTETERRIEKCKVLAERNSVEAV